MPRRALRVSIIQQSTDHAWFGPNHRLPVWFRSEVDDPAQPVTVRLYFRDGAGTAKPNTPWHLSELTVSAREDTAALWATDIRGARLRRAIDLSLANALIRVERDDDGNLVEAPEVDRYALAAAVERYWRELTTGKVGRPPLTPGQRKRILDLREELKGRRDWALEIERRMSISRSTIYKVLREANNTSGGEQ